MKKALDPAGRPWAGPAVGLHRLHPPQTVFAYFNQLAPSEAIDDRYQEPSENQTGNTSDLGDKCSVDGLYRGGRIPGEDMQPTSGRDEHTKHEILVG